MENNAPNSRASWNKDASGLIALVDCMLESYPTLDADKTAIVPKLRKYTRSQCYTKMQQIAKTHRSVSDLKNYKASLQQQGTAPPTPKFDQRAIAAQKLMSNISKSNLLPQVPVDDFEPQEIYSEEEEDFDLECSKKSSVLDPPFSPEDQEHRNSNEFVALPAPIFEIPPLPKRTRPRPSQAYDSPIRTVWIRNQVQRHWLCIIYGLPPNAEVKMLFSTATSPIVSEKRKILIQWKPNAVIGYLETNYGQLSSLEKEEIKLFETFILVDLPQEVKLLKDYPTKKVLNQQGMAIFTFTCPTMSLESEHGDGEELVAI